MAQLETDLSSSACIGAGLTKPIIERQSRQMLVPEIGAAGQAKISAAKVLVVGAGGLGCAVIPYLAGAGVGTLGVVDLDMVEASNLHRQVLHRQDGVNVENKADSATRFVRELNPAIVCISHREIINETNAIRLVQQYDVVVDATDNPRSRYILNDACVLAGKTLVSGSAVGLEGQLTVYNYHGGPCYRCVYPKPITGQASAPSCSDSGVLGPVPAVIGCLQATETLKVLADFGEVLSNQLVMYDARYCTFHKFKLPGRRKCCVVCGACPEIKSMDDSAAFCDHHDLRGYGGCQASVPPSLPYVIDKSAIGQTAEEATTSSLEMVPSCSVLEYCAVRSAEVTNGAGTRVTLRHLLLDVRDKNQFDMCHLPGAINLPLTHLKTKLRDSQGRWPSELTGKNIGSIYVICRRGIVSLAATQLLLRASFDSYGSGTTTTTSNSERPATAASLALPVINIRGGLTKWSVDVDPDFPAY